MLNPEQNHKKISKHSNHYENEYHYIISKFNPDLIIIFNNKFEIEYINEEFFFRILGYTKNDLIKKKPTDLIHPDDLLGNLKRKPLRPYGTPDLIYKNMYIGLDIEMDIIFGLNQKLKFLKIGMENLNFFLLVGTCLNVKRQN